MRHIASALLVALLFASVSFAAKPNVLLIMSDDQTWEDNGVYGSPNAITPNIDKLASQGMRFTHCFTATAMCAPTRQQLYTGVFPVRNGAYPNHSKVYPGTKSLVHHFKALGYRVGLSGKKHFGPADSFPFENVNGNKMAEFIGRDKEQPYFLIVTSHSPHLPWKEGDASQYDPKKLKLAPYMVDTPEFREALSKYYAEITDFDREVGEAMQLVDKSSQSDNTIFIYTSEQGAQVPRGKWTCYDTGLRTAMVVRWPKRIKAGAVSDAMVQYVDVVPTLIDAAGGDPTTIDTGRPGAIGENKTGFDGHSFLNVLDGKTDEHNQFVYGVHTTRGIIAGSESYPIRSVRTRTHKLIWNIRHDDSFRNITTHGRDKSMYWSSWIEKAKTDANAKRFVDGYQRRPEFELYEVSKDRYELNDLADDPKYKGIKDKLFAQLKAFMKQQGDKGHATEMNAGERQGRGGGGKKTPKKNAKQNAKN